MRFRHWPILGAALAALSAHVALFAFAASPVAAQTWPSKPVKLIVAYPPGGMIGAQSVVRADADGYTLLLAVGHGHLGLTDSINTAARIAGQQLGTMSENVAMRPAG